MSAAPRMEQRTWPDGTVMQYLKPRELALSIALQYKSTWVPMPIVISVKRKKK